MMAGFDREGIADMMFVQGRAELRDRVAFWFCRQQLVPAMTLLLNLSQRSLRFRCGRISEPCLQSALQRISAPTHSSLN